MATGKKRRTTSLRENPQNYEHRVECAIEAQRYVLMGAQKINSFLSAQQCPGWPMYELTRDAEHQLRLALQWLKNARKYHGQRRG